MAVMYVCDSCRENSPEICGRDDPSEIRVIAGRWLCEDCFNDEFGFELWLSYPMPAKYEDAVEHVAAEVERGE